MLQQRFQILDCGCKEVALTWQAQDVSSVLGSAINLLSQLAHAFFFFCNTFVHLNFTAFSARMGFLLVFVSHIPQWGLFPLEPWAALYFKQLRRPKSLIILPKSPNGTETGQMGEQISHHVTILLHYPTKNQLWAVLYSLYSGRFLPRVFGKYWQINEYAFTCDLLTSPRS